MRHSAVAVLGACELLHPFATYFTLQCDLFDSLDSGAHVWRTVQHHSRLMWAMLFGVLSSRCE